MVTQWFKMHLIFKLREAALFRGISSTPPPLSPLYRMLVHDRVIPSHKLLNTHFMQLSDTLKGTVRAACLGSNQTAQSRGQQTIHWATAPLKGVIEFNIYRKSFCGNF